MQPFEYRDRRIHCYRFADTGLDLDEERAKTRRYCDASRCNKRG
jgi:hypothetical protein